MSKNSQADLLKLEMEEDQQDRLVLLGASFWGTLYRSEKFPACYRLFPIAQVPINKRNAVREWMQRPRKRTVAPIVAAGQGLADGQTVFYVRYEVDAQLTWARLLEDPRADFYTKLASAILVLRAFSEWRDLLHDDPQQFFLPTPEDVVLVNDTPHLLALPFWEQPDIEAVFALPRCGLYLAPELVRGRENEIWGRNLDLYALGSTLFQTIFDISEIERTENILERVAQDSLFAASYCTPRYPFWMEKTDAFHDLLADVKRMLHPNIRIRSAVDPVILADRMEQCLTQLDPATAVRELVKKDRALAAFALLQDIFLEQTSSQLLLLSAEIAGKNLGRPVEAIDTLEQIIRREPGNTAASAAQLELILAHLDQAWHAMIDADVRIWRDFRALSPEQQQPLELELAHYLLRRESFQEAAQFIYSRLFEENRYAWWKFGMAIAYATVLLRTGQLDDASQQIQDIKARLQWVGRNRSLSDSEIHLFGAQVAELEIELLRRKAHK